MGKVFNSMVLGIITTLGLAIFNASGFVPTSLFLLLLNPSSWSSSNFWSIFSVVLTASGFIIIGIAAIIRQDWLVRAGMITALSSVVVAPFIDLYSFLVSVSNYISAGCSSGSVAPICSYVLSSGNNLAGVGQFIAIIFAGPLIIYSIWGCIEYVWRGDGF